VRRTEGTGIQCVVEAFILKNRIIIEVLKMEWIGTYRNSRHRLQKVDSVKFSLWHFEQTLGFGFSSAD